MQNSGPSALVAGFKKYDKDNTGQLDLLEFEKIAESMGYGSVAHVIFQSLDADGSGTISYQEIVDSLTISGTPLECSRRVAQYEGVADQIVMMRVAQRNEPVGVEAYEPILELVSEANSG